MFAQIVNSLILTLRLKVKDIVVRYLPQFFFEKLDRSVKSVLCM